MSSLTGGASHSELSCTVIATVRNEASNITHFITSLLEQSHKPDNIIIVDGMSTDGTNQILKSFEDDRFITLLTEDCNIAQGRNLAIEHADTPLIASTDAGCVVDKDWLLEITRPFYNESPPDVVAGNFDFDCHNSFEAAVVLATNDSERTRTDESKYSPSSRSIAFTKAIWQKAKGYPEWLYAAEDTLFNIRMRQLGATFVFAEAALVKWRPRTTWYSLGKQFYNYARGNGRIGFATHGYVMNLKNHGMIAAPLLASLLWPWLALLAIYPAYTHCTHNLLPQARRASKTSSGNFVFMRVLLIMEFVRITGMAGFIRGRLDRKLDPSYIEQQLEWMDAASVEESP